MSYSLSFSPEFFFAEGEPYDRSDLALNADGEPYSVYSALCLMQQKDKRAWNAMARDVFGCPGRHLSPETVLDRIQETNRCGTISSPVDVWIDSEGHYTVDVHDASHYSYGSGSPGCLYDNGPHYAQTKEQAIEGALFIFGDCISGREMKRAKVALRREGIYYFSPHARAHGAGADYVEICEQRGPCPEND